MLKTGFIELGCEGVHLVELVDSGVEWRAFVNTEDQRFALKHRIS
jgi:hypothetical protein